VEPVEHAQPIAGGEAQALIGQGDPDPASAAADAVADSVVVEAFREAGWEWGGDWNSPKDYQHFSAAGT